jgi:hypothetical protein
MEGNSFDLYFIPFIKLLFNSVAALYLVPTPNVALHAQEGPVWI